MPAGLHKQSISFAVLSFFFLAASVFASVSQEGEIKSASFASIGNFFDSGDTICTENGKPIIVMFSRPSADCPCCAHLKPAFDSIIQKYQTQQGAIAAKYLTDYPGYGAYNAEHAKASSYINNAGYTPTFSFGCRYYRPTNYSDLSDCTSHSVQSEITAMSSVIDTLIALTNKPPVGNFAGAFGTVLTGWTCDPNSFSSALQVKIYYDGQKGSGGILLGNTTANVYDSSTGQNCGGTYTHKFSLEIPSAVRDGKTHSVYAYATDLTSGTDTLLQSAVSPVTFNIPAPTCPHYTYTNWSACDSSGKQYRLETITQSTCPGNAREATEKSCSFVPDCTEQNWILTLDPAVCPESGAQIENWQKQGTCQNGVQKASGGTVACTYQAPECAYAYTDFGQCREDGIKSREASAKSPANCEGIPDLTRVCIYTPPICSGNTVKNCELDSAKYCGLGIQQCADNNWQICEQGDSVICTKNQFCADGFCKFCEEGKKNCDASLINGCESNITTDRKNCGECGVKCEVGKDCINGVCSTDATPSCQGVVCKENSSCNSQTGSCECSLDYFDCDLNSLNGCESRVRCAGECVSNDDCAGQKVCSEGICAEQTPNCLSDSDCPQDQECAGGACLLLECQKDFTAKNHACMCEGMVCGAVCHAKAGVCCNDKWNEDANSCEYSVDAQIAIVNASNDSEASQLMQDAISSLQGGEINKGLAQSYLAELKAKLSQAGSPPEYAETYEEAKLALQENDFEKAQRLSTDTIENLDYLSASSGENAVRTAGIVAAGILLLLLILWKRKPKTAIVAAPQA